MKSLFDVIYLAWVVDAENGMEYNEEEEHSPTSPTSKASTLPRSASGNTVTSQTGQQARAKKAFFKKVNIVVKSSDVIV